MPGAHAKLSASGAHRWLACPGSVQLEQHFEDTTSAYAEEGTLAHAVAELKLTKYFKGMGPKKFSNVMAEFEKSPHWSREIDTMTDVYVDEIKRLALVYPSEPFINIEERLDFSEWAPEGFGTADYLMIYGDQLTVCDLKYGKGVPVEATENPQGLLYMLGAYAAYRFIYDIKRARFGIIQPRLDAVKYWEISVDDLLAFGEKVKPIARQAFDGCDEFHAGEHCRFCKAKAKCGERGQQMFKVVETINHTDKSLLSHAEIGAMLGKCKGVADWISDLEDMALAELLKGEKIDGYKVVEGRSNRKITDEPRLASALEGAGFDEAVIYKPRALETITNLEKIVGKADFAKLAKGCIEKPQGKPTLVPESDKRPPYVKDFGFEKNIKI